MLNSKLKTLNSKLPHGIGVIVLAAGRGSRMGATPKLLLPLQDGRPIIRHAVGNALEWGPSEVIVVVRPDLPAIKEALADLPVTCAPNPRYEEGMATSLAVGIGALSSRIDVTLVVLGDEPYVAAHIVMRLMAMYLSERKPVTIPKYGEQVGPPTLFARSIFPELLTLGGDIGGKQLLSKYPNMVCLVPFKEEDRPRDVDTPEDYRALL
ncbi:MAG TPA: nucleotidyltransferase family protein [Chloroflexia bacterium]|nr:nucleotidyltransferase family protein [Chloroflexia bacterium]